MTDNSEYVADGPYGEIRFDGTIRSFGPELAATLTVEEPYRETYGHSAKITPTIARELAAELLLFADKAEQQTAKGKTR